MTDDRRSGVLKDRRIIVVEDEYLIAQSLCDTLEKAGAVVLGPVARTRQAFDLIAREIGQLDAVVLDIDLGGEKTYAIADILASRGIRFVFATGYGDEAIPAPYQRYPRVEKPRDPVTVLAALISEAG